MSFRIIILSVVVICLQSCENTFFGSSKASYDAFTNFEYLWRQCDEKYAFFEDKEVDWDKIYTDYSRLISISTNEIELFDILADMLNTLKDGHVDISSPFNSSHYNFESNRADNYELGIIKRNYLSDNYYITGSIMHDFLYRRQGRADLHIGYIRLSRFGGNISDNLIDTILSRYIDSTKGLIIDIRENPGGSSADVIKLLEHLVSKKTAIYYLQNKAGKSHEDFTEIEPVYINPSSGINYTNKVVVLTDGGTFSAGSFFSLATKAISNISLVGDYTGGGLGLPNGGQLPNGWFYRLSVTRTLDKDGKNYESTGVPPDIRANLNYSNLSVDEIIESAIDEINRSFVP